MQTRGLAGWLTSELSGTNVPREQMMDVLGLACDNPIGLFATDMTSLAAL